MLLAKLTHRINTGLTTPISLIVSTDKSLFKFSLVKCERSQFNQVSKVADVEKIYTYSQSKNILMLQMLEVKFYSIMMY